MDLINRAEKLLQLVVVAEHIREKYPNIFTGYASEAPETSKESNKYFKGCLDD